MIKLVKDGPKFKLLEDFQMNVGDVKEPYAIDSFIGPNEDGKVMFRDIQSMVNSTLDGYNSIIFNYGFKNSGKSFHLLESPDNSIYKQAIDLLFTKKALINKTSKVTLKLHMIQVRSDTIGVMHDLL